MEPFTSPGHTKRYSVRQFALLALCLFLLLSFFFRRAYLPDYTVFSNDGPLGGISSQCARLPGTFYGLWQDLNWLGGAGPGAVPNLSTGLNLFSGSPLAFSKLYAPFATFFLGLSVWFCLRQWKFSPLACFLGGLAGTLNGDFLSTACWGVAGQPICFGLNFLALGAAAPRTGMVGWLRLVLAGFAIGLGVTEAFDIGAIFSLFTGAFILFKEMTGEGAPAPKAVKGIARLALVSICAAFIATGALATLIGTQIQGVAGMGQDEATKQARWDQATQWSLPKSETLSVIIPGLFGYRMDTPDGGNYWGAIGRDAQWDRYLAAKQGPPPDPHYFLRYSGGGVYAGVSVVLIAIWGLIQSLRKDGSPFSPAQKKLIWFWGIAALLGLLLAFGKYAPFYRLFYSLLYASTMRNPAKFVHVVNFAIVILFGFGVDALSRRFFDSPATALRGLPDQIKTWWAKAHLFDKRFTKVLLFSFIVSVIGWFLYSRSRGDLLSHLQETGFGAEAAAAIASFSLVQVGKFVLLFALTLGLLIATLSGYFSGNRARLGGILLGVIVCVDLAWADVPWPITYNWKEKYESNPIIDLLRKNPWEARVAVVPFQPPQQLALVNQLYESEWKQQLFQFYNVQSLNDVQRPRPSEDFIAFETAFTPTHDTNTMNRVTRHWELTNTRYFIGAAGFVPVLNEQLDPAQKRFRVVQAFNIVPKPGVAQPMKFEELTAVPEANGQFALIEFTGAMPRASLYSNWQVSTNDQETLKKLASADFDPRGTVLVANQIAPATNPGTNAPGTVEYQSYASRDVILKARASAPSILLLNDKNDANWKVLVDGKPQPLLRCNYVMRGVQLPAGEHKVEFHFRQPMGPVYVSFAAVGMALLLLGITIVQSRKAPAN